MDHTVRRRSAAQIRIAPNRIVSVYVLLTYDADELAGPGVQSDDCPQTTRPTTGLRPIVKRTAD
jgi:hypothetical protein